MGSRKSWKQAARRNLKRHYMLFVIACLALAVLGAAYSHSLTTLRAQIPGVAENQAENGTGMLVGGNGFETVAEAILEDQLERGDELAKENEAAYRQDNSGMLSRSRGVIAQVVNSITSGSILVIIAETLISIFHSSHIMILILILASFLLALIWWIFFKNVASVVVARLFLEGRLYEKVPAHRILFLWDTSCWCRTACTMLYTGVLLFLWSLTCIGGLIKRYSYYLVPFIAAENPKISPREAVNLSRKMMNGHKWECFLLELSFIGWNFLGVITAGLSELLFSNPYRTATVCEYYACLRSQAIEQQIEGSGLLCDRCLYEKASAEELEKAYPIEEIPELCPASTNSRNGVQRFISDVFGIAATDSQGEQAWQQAEEAKQRDKGILDARTGKIYPIRLSGLTDREYRGVFRPEHFHYIRHYSVLTLTLVFFAFSMVGWLWEVSLHLISDGAFVNRGALLGPWIPIYGSGAVLILTLLNCLRRKPSQEFAGIVLLCGIVEYFTSVYLEKIHNGMRWWDYTGYLLNLNGRVCAEGLLVFGIGGMAIVYLLAPRLDSFLQRVPKKIRVCLCILLLTLFAVDLAYSTLHPNMGIGITSYAH